MNSGGLQITLLGAGKPKRRPDNRLGVGGYALSLDAIAEAYASLRAYPATLSASFDQDSAELFAAWLAQSGSAFEPDETPWVPVGRVGPLLVLGHTDPAAALPPLPHGAFQPVVLRRDDYERQLAAASLAIRALDVDSLKGRFPLGVGKFPKPLVWPTERQQARHFIQSYFIQHPSDSDQLDSVSVRGVDVREDQLPIGYAAAIEFLCQGTPVFSSAALRLNEQEQKRVPASLQKKVIVLAELSDSDEHHLFCAASSLPQVEAEDMLYAELGNSWKIHWVLRAPDRSGVTQPAPHQAPNPSSIVLSTTKKGAKKDGEVSAADERTITLKHELWDSYEPRNRDARAEDLWQWSLYRAVMDGATDLHIEPGEGNAVVRIRIDGDLEHLLTADTKTAQQMVASAKAITGLESDLYRPIDGSFKVVIDSRDKSKRQEVRIRASGYPVLGSMQKLALRILPRSGHVPDLSTLVNGRAYPILKRAVSRSEGLILVCGPTGAGKTTTLFSILQGLNSPDRNITTLENPIEIVLPGLNQAEVNDRREVGWSELNRSFLRQDPDIGLIGEVRDEETAKTILRIALTGHLVLASLHTLSCPTSVIRMMDLGAQQNMLAEALIVVVSQRLIRRVCTSCSSTTESNSQERELFSYHGLEVPTQLTRACAGGCEDCRSKGYRGRIAAVEILPNVRAVRRMIEEGKSSQDYFQWMKKHKLPTIFENALELAAQGLTTMEEALSIQDAWDGAEWDEYND